MTKKKVAVFDMDPTNGGLVKYIADRDRFSGVVPVPPMASPSEFFGGSMLDEDPDAVLIDLPGNPLKHMGGDMTLDGLVEIVFGCRDFGYVPIPVYPVTTKAVSSDSLEFALGAFPAGPFGVYFNEYGVARAHLDAGSAYSSYDRLKESVLSKGGIEFTLPALYGSALSRAVDVLLMPFEIGFPIAEDGRSVSPKEMLAEITEWLTSRGVSAGDSRGAYMNLKQFLRSSLPEIEAFVLQSVEHLEASGDKPVFMPYSDKGGEGKSYMTRLLEVYLRRYWANGLRYADAPLS